MTMTPSQVLDNYRSFVDLIEADHMFSVYLQACIGSTMPGQQDVCDQQGNAKRIAVVRNLYSHSIVPQIKEAKVYQVTDNMCALLQSVAAQLDDDDIFDSDLAPSRQGYVRFDKPIEMTDRGGRSMLVHTLVWGRSPEGTFALLSNDANIEPDEVWRDILMEAEAAERDREIDSTTKRLLVTYQKFGFCSFNRFNDGDVVGPPYVAGEEGVGALLDTFSDGRKVYSTSGSNIMRIVHALWLLFGQTITQTVEERADRATRRRAARLNLPENITVVHLRRTKRADDDPDHHVERHYSHQWIVDSHLVWRKCGPDLPGAVPYEKGWRRRRILADYVKGPRGAPLRLKAKVYSLSR